MKDEVLITPQRQHERLRLILGGQWTVANTPAAEEAIGSGLDGGEPAQRIELDLAGIERLDTAGAWLIHRTAKALAGDGRQVAYVALTPTARILLEEVESNDREPPEPRRQPPALVRLVSDTGEGAIEAVRDIVALTSLLGRTVIIMLSLLIRPWRFRLTSMTFHLEHSGIRAVPIIVLISVLIGAIIEQQGVYQLRNFGAEILSIDLAGILILREIGVLLTAIMVAGRTGSSITAEIGSMKMREEIDALRTLALDPIEVLIVPRLLALIVALPLLTFIADITALVGAAAVAWIYIDMSPSTFIAYLRTAVDINTVLVGLIKAPFMALVIGLIACHEGLQVEGSAESLGLQTTASVVKSIFVVIVLDGLFAMFFAAIDF